MAITSETKLAIYNGALRRLGSRPLASLAENRGPRRVLDGIWGAADNVVKLALEKGEWNFAIKTVQGVYSESVEPPFGLSRAYDKPDDLRRLVTLCPDEYMRNPLIDGQYSDEAGYWFTDSQELFIRYVSDATDYGLNSGAWTESFKDYLECDLAWKACETLTNSTGKRDRIERDRMNALKGAKSLDAMGEGVKFPPRGSWASSRGRGPYQT